MSMPKRYLRSFSIIRSWAALMSFIAIISLAETAKAAAVYKPQWFSDHAPLAIDRDLAM